jgi:hypothetical protein
MAGRKEGQNRTWNKKESPVLKKGKKKASSLMKGRREKEGKLKV